MFYHATIRHNQKKEIMRSDVTFGIPRFFLFEENTYMEVKNSQFNFTEIYYYLKGQYKITLKMHQNKIYLSKEKLS